MLQNISEPTFLEVLICMGPEKLVRRGRRRRCDFDDCGWTNKVGFYKMGQIRSNQENDLGFGIR